MKSTWISLAFTRCRSASSATWVGEAVAERDVARRVLVEERVEEHGVAAAPIRPLAVDERQLAETPRTLVLGNGRAERLGVLVGVDPRHLAARELDPQAPDDRPESSSGMRRAHVPVHAQRIGVVKTSSLGRFGKCTRPSMVVNSAASQCRRPEEAERQSVPGP